MVKQSRKLENEASLRDPMEEQHARVASECTKMLCVARNLASNRNTPVLARSSITNSIHDMDQKTCEDAERPMRRHAQENKKTCQHRHAWTIRTTPQVHEQTLVTRQVCVHSARIQFLDATGHGNRIGHLVDSEVCESWPQHCRHCSLSIRTAHQYSAISHVQLMMVTQTDTKILQMSMRRSTGTDV